MLKHAPFLASIVLAAHAAASPADLSGSEVRIPYAELVRLLDAGAAKRTAADPPRAPDPALASATFRLRFSGSTPSLQASFHISNPGRIANIPVPILPASVRIISLSPANAPLLVRDRTICLATSSGESSSVDMEFDFSEDTLSFSSPPCPCPVIEIPAPPANTAVKLTLGERTMTVRAATRIALPACGTQMGLQIISRSAAEEAPPTPSAWSWQHDAIVSPVAGMLQYHIFSHASASGGSGTEARLRFPADARRIEASGKDLTSHDVTRDTKGVPFLTLKWATRSILDRAITVSYSTPLRPLDRQWTLAAPFGTDSAPTQTRFLIPENPRLEFTADGLTPAVDASSLSSAAAREAGNAAVRILEAGHEAKLTVRELPVAATADATIATALWKTRIEPDGSSLTEGNLAITYQRAQQLLLTLPREANLVSCTVEDRPVDPILHGDALGIPLDARNGVRPADVRISYTLRVEKPDPLRGSLPMILPVTPLLIKGLSWDISLPAAYKAEISGNLERGDNTQEAPQTIHLRKNLCRGEQPSVRIFYSRR
jgi:hypothetical protein